MYNALTNITRAGFELANAIRLRRHYPEKSARAIGSATIGLIGGVIVVSTGTLWIGIAIGLVLLVAQSVRRQKAFSRGEMLLRTFLSTYIPALCVAVSNVLGVPILGLIAAFVLLLVIPGVIGYSLFGPRGQAQNIERHQDGYNDF